MFQHRYDVVLVARGAHRDAIATRGLTVNRPEGSVTLPIPVAGSPGEIVFRDGDVVLVAVKSQDTAGLVESLAASAPPRVPIVCLQNGVANEAMFLRRFAAVYAATVLVPASHLIPGVVEIYTPRAAAFLDVGRWPGGADATSEAVAAAFRSSGFNSVSRPDIRRWKYTKLLLNLGNAVSALCPEDADSATIARLAREEGGRVLDAASIAYASAEEDLARRGGKLPIVPIGGRTKPGASTWQSLTRRVPAEVDYLNGEIVLLGRLHGIPAPVNELLQQSVHDAVAAGAGPASVPAADLLDRLRRASPSG
jgi:2-dehydropantoate 2-reductase